jgi:hypothetical protein
VRRASDDTTQDIGTASPGAQVDLSALSSFCTGTTCSVSILYDQTGNGNDLKSGLVLDALTTNNVPATANNEPMVQYWTTSFHSSKRAGCRWAKAGMDRTIAPAPFRKVWSLPTRRPTPPTTRSRRT